ncbi:AtuA-related protein [Nitrogeniibacter aestuarii]|uniref:AtuA-related protein n=1 Tax=Nitrogeniibacter aestuarii TaxID=2815343 RepID=UPI001D118F88|nr:hypothetical protein [Nitrogeniibacter aestuarii]
MNTDDFIEVPLHRIAHARTGDKGNRINVALFCYEPGAYPHIVEQVTEAAVMACYRHRHPSAVKRYLVPTLSACNFVIDDVLAGGVNNSLCLDRHGKGLSFLLLNMPVRVPRKCVTAS